MSKTVLVVEDDRSLQKLIQEILEQEGFRVICEQDGEWAVQSFESHEIDFAIVDVLVPSNNGFQVVERIRKHPQRGACPIVMISGIYRRANHCVDAISRYQILDFLEKPIDFDELIGILKDVFAENYPSLVATQAEKAAMDAKAPESYASPDTRREKEEVEERSVEFDEAQRHGDLSENPFPELLAELYQEKHQGALLLRRSKVKKIVYFRNGYPVFIRSNLLNECLGKLMVKERLISESDCEASIRLMKKSGRQQGTVLIEMGSISPHNLQYALELQLRVKLLNLFGWSSGDYRYNRVGDVPATAISLGSSTAALIYEGVCQHYGITRLKALLDESLDQWVKAHPDPLFRFQDMLLNDSQERFVSHLDGKNTLREVLNLGLEEESTYRIIYALKCARMITLEPSVTVRLAEGGGVPVPAISDVGHRIRINSKDRSLREGLVREVDRMRELDYFQILGIPQDANEGAISKAYFYMAKRYHPDRLYSLASAEVRRLAEELFALVAKAHDVLIAQQSRASYLTELRKGLQPELGLDGAKVLKAEAVFQEGEFALSQKEYARAKEKFSEAVSLCSQEGEFLAYLAWATFQSAPKNEDAVHQAQEMLVKAVALDPRVDKAYLFSGYIHKAMNQVEMAERDFEKAIQCNPDCTEALRELRLFTLHKDKRRASGPAPARQ